MPMAARAASCRRDGELAERDSEIHALTLSGNARDTVPLVTTWAVDDRTIPAWASAFA